MSWLNTKKASCWRSSGRSATKSVTTNDAGTGNPAEQPARGAKQQPATETSRAGRDLRAAIVVGLSIGLVLIAVLVFVPRVWVAIVAVATLVATHEVVRRLREAGYLIPVIPLLIGGQAAVWLTWPFGAVGALAGFGGMVVVCMIWRLFMQDSVTRPTTGGAPSPGNYLSDVSATVFLAVWVPLFCSFGAMLVYPENGSGWVFCMMIAVIASDVGATPWGCCLASIRWFRRSAEEVVGGFAGSLVCGITATIITATFLVGKTPWIGALLGVLFVLTTALGDLVESQVKRDLGIKDMGRLLPGHGGLMDRLDGILPSAVAAWIVLTLLP